ncbi:hypothetical protein B0T11DRAFT_271398, partial [Plectosphaerella cucumerina]
MPRAVVIFLLLPVPQGTPGCEMGAPTALGLGAQIEVPDDPGPGLQIHALASCLAVSVVGEAGGGSFLLFCPFDIRGSNHPAEHVSGGTIWQRDDGIRRELLSP